MSIELRSLVRSLVQNGGFFYSKLKKLSRNCFCYCHYTVALNCAAIPLATSLLYFAAIFAWLLGAVPDY